MHRSGVVKETVNIIEPTIRKEVLYPEPISGILASSDAVYVLLHFQGRLGIEDKANTSRCRPRWAFCRRGPVERQR